MKRYSALIIDLKKSKSYNKIDRTEIQNYIKDTISVLNKVFSNVIELDVVFSAGDEVQGLFSSPQAAYLYYRMFNVLVFPVKIRAGIGVGDWDVKIDSNISTEQDGTAYHNARHAIENVKDSLGYYILLSSNDKNDIYINSAINIATILLNNQSQYQNELFSISELMHPIDIDDMLRLDYFRELRHLIEKKNQINYYTQGIQEHLFSSISYNFILECNPINALADESNFYVSSGKIKGLSIELTKLLGKSRQSIEKTIKSGNIYQERNSTIVALKLMNQFIREDK